MGSLAHATDAHYDSFYVQHVGDEAVSYLLILSAVQSIFFERKMETQLHRGPGQPEPGLPPSASRRLPGAGGSSGNGLGFGERGGLGRRGTLRAQTGLCAVRLFPESYEGGRGLPGLRLLLTSGP